jgi:hypothetical protein
VVPPRRERRRVRGAQVVAVESGYAAAALCGGWGQSAMAQRGPNGRGAAARRPVKNVRERARAVRAIRALRASERASVRECVRECVRACVRNRRCAWLISRRHGTGRKLDEVSVAGMEPDSFILWSLRTWRAFMLPMLGGMVPEMALSASSSW